MRPHTAKILVHSEGVGAPHLQLVRKRAAELARIDGRSEYSEADWRQAKIELHGSQMPDGSQSDEMAMTSMVSEGDMIAANVGHHVGRMPMEDDGNVVEELYAEGMEEAVHERMLAARDEQDGEDEAEE